MGFCCYSYAERIIGTYSQEGSTAVKIRCNHFEYTSTLAVALRVKQIWRMLGRIPVPIVHDGWRRSTGYVPTALVHRPDTIRVFAGFQDLDNIGRVGYIDVDANDPLMIREISTMPVLDVGRPGTFDEHGVTPLATLDWDDELLLFYAGWQRLVSVRYSLFTGLARSRNRGVSFERVSDVPILDRSAEESIVRTGGTIVSHGGSIHLFYAAGSTHVIIDGRPVPYYDLVAAQSTSPFFWPKVGLTILTPASPDEFGFGRPAIIVERGVWRMWLSVRTRPRGYRLSYAESLDGRSWTRYDDALHFVGRQEAWDAQSRAFASIVDVPRGRIMFYNGNEYGADGFGAAILEQRAVAY